MEHNRVPWNLVRRTSKDGTGIVRIEAPAPISPAWYRLVEGTKCIAENVATAENIANFEYIIHCVSFCKDYESSRLAEMKSLTDSIQDAFDRGYASGEHHLNQGNIDALEEALELIAKIVVAWDGDGLAEAVNEARIFKEEQEGKGGRQNV